LLILPVLKTNIVVIKKGVNICVPHTIIYKRNFWIKISTSLYIV